MSRVLVVEDDASIRALLREALTADGHTVHAVADGQAAVAHWQQARPDLVVLDLMLPEMDGLAVLTALAQARPPLPVIIITAYPLARAVAQVTAAQPDAHVRYLSKPFDLDDLRANVALALGGAAGA